MNDGFPQRLRMLRERRGMSRKALGECCGNWRRGWRAMNDRFDCIMSIAMKMKGTNEKTDELIRKLHSAYADYQKLKLEYEGAGCWTVQKRALV